MKLISKTRWLIMIGCFLVFTFGVHILGIRVPIQYTLPIFSCPINYETTIGGGCYNLCHVQELLTAPVAYILFFIIMTLVVIIVLGRILCGFLCPIGFIQDALNKLRQVLKIDQIKLTEKHYKVLKYVKWAMAIIFFTGSIFWAFNFCEVCPVVMFIPPLAGIKFKFNIALITGILFIVFAFFKRRFWCNICPLGFMLGLFHRISFISLKKECQSCTECGACYEACPMGIKTILTERKKELVSTVNCLMCTECVTKCPEKNALAFSYLGKKFYKASRKRFFDYQKVIGLRQIIKEFYSNTRTKFFGYRKVIKKKIQKI